MNESKNFNKIKFDKRLDDSGTINLKTTDGIRVVRSDTRESFSQEAMLPKAAKRNRINTSEIFGKLIKGVIYLAVFLMPLFVIPFNSEYWEIPKQYLLVLLGLSGLILWFVKSIFIDHEIKIRFAALDLAVFLFVALSTVSALFGVDPIMSLLGYYGNVSGSMLEILSLGIFYFLIVNSSVSGYKLARTFIASSLIASAISLLWITGIFAKILPQSIINEFPFLSLKLVNTMGASSSVLVWQLAAIVTFIIGAVFTKKSVIAGENIANNFQNNKGKKKYTIAFFLPFIIIFIIVLSLPQFKNPVSQDSVLSNKTSWEIVQNKINSKNIKNIIIGSGPATFFYDFSLFKPASFNQDANWNLRFSKSGSGITEKIITIGAAGVILYVLLLIMFFYTVFRSRKIRPEFASAVLLFSAVLILNQLINPESGFLNFSFWLMFSVGSAVFAKPSVKTFSLSDFSPASRSALTGIGVAVVILLVFGFYQAGKFYAADIVYARAIKSANAENNDAVEKDINRAIKYNPYRYEYHTILAKLYLKEINEIIKDPQLSKDAEKSAKVASLADKAIKEGKKAAEIAPSNVIAHETLGLVYANMSLLVNGANEWAGKSFSRALELDPVNPVLITELGKNILAGIGNASGQDAKIDEAISEFQKALNLKPDYYEASLRMALALEKKGETDQAIKNLEEIESAAGNNLMLKNSEVVFQLGRLYYNDGRTEEAILQFQKVISYYPNYSNALYSLGLAYEKIGKKSEAKAEFNKVLQLNPENKEIKDKIKKLESSTANDSVDEEISNDSGNEELP